MSDLKKLVACFGLEGEITSSRPFGSGHINDTFKVALSNKEYIFQRINTDVFSDPQAMMNNITSVCDHLKQKLKPAEKTKTLNFLQSKEGAYLVSDDEGGLWRCMDFLKNTRSYDVVPSIEMAHKGAAAFGYFQSALVDFEGSRLSEIIPDFHHTPKRFSALHESIQADVVGRVKEVRAEIDFMLERESKVSTISDGLASGEIPERITHNDTKFNNLLFDEQGLDVVCVVDLDTVMPGSVLYDFGDLVRTCTCEAAEDEEDLSKVFLRSNIFKALVEGYLSEAGSFLVDAEVDLLVYSGQLITLELGSRFLCDYLMGDIYFKTHREKHNLDRARTQIKLIQSIEEEWGALEKIVNECRR